MNNINECEANSKFGEYEDQLPTTVTGGIKVSCNFKHMTKEMCENFVKQGKKFATLTGQEFDSLEETGNDLDGDIIVVDGQNYVVNSSTWRR